MHGHQVPIAQNTCTVMYQRSKILWKMYSILWFLLSLYSRVYMSYLSFVGQINCQFPSTRNFSGLL